VRRVSTRPPRPGWYYPAVVAVVVLGGLWLVWFVIGLIFGLIRILVLVALLVLVIAISVNRKARR
jgi:uncharacterized membrane protein